MSSPGSGSVRRSSRRRTTPAPSVYDEAAALVLQSTADSQSTSSTSKRRRSRKEESSDEENNDPPAEEEESESSSDDDDDDDDAAESKSRKKSTRRPAPIRRRAITLGASQPPASKKPKAAAAPPSSSAAAWKSLRQHVLRPDDAEDSLLRALWSVGPRGASALATLCQSLVRKYAPAENALHVQLYNLVFRLVGADTALPLDLDLEHVAEERLTEYVQAVVLSMAESALPAVLWTAAPLPGAAKAHFRTLVQEFWHGLAVAMLASTTATDDDDEPMDDALRVPVEGVRNLVTRLSEMVFLQEEDLRSAFCSATYAVATAILHKTVALKEECQTAERQYKVAKRHKQGRKAEALQVQIHATKRALEDLEDIVVESVMAVFHKRYKDVNPFIRAAAMLALADFCCIRPDIFMKAKYLKYAGWTLSDKNEVVREAAVRAFLQPCQGKHHDKSIMEGVAEKFSPRLADITMDVDPKCAERAMELFLLWSRDGLLDSVADEDTWTRINLRALDDGTTPGVRKGALLFIIEQLGAFDEQGPDTEASAAERFNELATWVAHVLSLDDIPMENIRFNLAAYIIESLRAHPKHYSLSRNFGALVKALEDSLNVSFSESRKARRERKDLDVKHRILLEFLMTAVEEEVPLMSDIVDPDLRAVETKKRKISVQSQMTRSLLPILPKLMASFKSETSVVQRLAQLPLHFAPSECQLSNQKQNFKNVLTALSKCFMESGETEVLQNCCHSMSFLAAEDYARRDDAMGKLRGIVSLLRGRLDELVSEKSRLGNGEISDNEDMDEDEDHKSSAEGVHHAVSLCLRRLAVVSKRWPLVDLVEDMDEEEKKASIEALCEQVSGLVTHELEIRKPVTEGETTVIPRVWDTPGKSHEYVKTSVTAAMTILLTSTGWATREMEAALGAASTKDGNDKLVHDAAALVPMRDRMETVLALCFEQFLDGDREYSEDHVAFAAAVQEEAGCMAGDVRTLFPRAWSSSVHPCIRELALVDDSHLIGGYVRFVRSQENQLRDGGNIDEGDPWLARKYLMPMARGLCPNWSSGNRREAGAALSHITNSGSESSAIISTMSKVLKKIKPVRLLEAHMACLRQEFESWAEHEPEEPESDKPTDEENAAFEAAEEAHEQNFQALQTQAQRLSASLGVGKLSDPILANALLGFVREGIRFAFSRDVPGSDEVLFLGARLPFLRILAKYLVWVRKNKQRISIIRAEFNLKEEEVRSDPEFHHILETDVEALTQFRKIGNLGAFVVEDEDTVAGGRSLGTASRASSVFRRRLSQASSVSSIPSKVSTNKSDLSPLPEEKDGDSDDDDDVSATVQSPAGNSSLASSRLFSPESRVGLSSQASLDGSREGLSTIASPDSKTGLASPGESA